MLSSTCRFSFLEWRGFLEPLKAPLYPLFFLKLPLTAHQLHLKPQAPFPLLRLSTFYNWGPTHSWPALFHHALVSASVFLWRLFSPPLSFLWASQPKTALCEWTSVPSSFPLLLFSLGSLFIPHYCITFLLRGPLSCIITESRSLSQTSPSLAHSEGATTLFQNMSPVLLCSLFPSGPLKLFQLCVPPFNVIFLEKLSKIFYYVTRVTVNSCLNLSSCFK